MITPDQQSYLRRLLFADIQTVSAVPEYDSLDAPMRKLWDQRAAAFRETGDKSPAELWQERAGLYAEFGRIVCIGLGYFVIDAAGHAELRIKSLQSDSEIAVLDSFTEMLKQARFNGRGNKQTILCAHNGKEFDFPFLCRRLLLNNLPLPDLLDIMGRKPWDIPHADTMELWRFGEKRAYVSLAGLALLFGLNGAENEIEKVNVSELWYSDARQTVAAHARRQVALTAQVLMRLLRFPALREDQLVFVEE
ncbi:MAG: ribonuclease H-like domain-containing protein [Bacteroidota bacterium]